MTSHLIQTWSSLMSNPYTQDFMVIESKLIQSYG